LQVEAYAKGTSPTGPTKPYFGVTTSLKDDPTVANWTVSGAANNGSGLIRLTVTGHGVATGDSVGVYGVVGATQANGQWIVTKIDANHVDLVGSAFSSAYVSGGTMTNRAAYYGAFFAVAPAVTRSGLTGTAAAGDDVNGIGVFNSGTVPATSGYLVNRNSAFGATSEYYQAIEIEANADVGLRMIGAYQWGIDLYGAGAATYSTGLIRLPNNKSVWARNNADSADVALFRLRTNDEFEILATGMRLSPSNSTVSVTDAVNFDIGSTTGTKIGLGTSQKLGFWNATPVVQQVLATGAGKTVDNVISLLQTLGLCKQS
jgi:hypothetical protein